MSLSTLIPSTPGQFFHWCLENANSDLVPFRANYAHYYDHRGGSEYLWNVYDQRLADIIPIASAEQKVLEIGCGIGSDLHWLALMGCKATGIDVKSEWIDAANELTKVVSKNFGPVGVDIRRINLLDMPAEQFDLIYMKDTFHHLEPRVEVTAKIASMLRPGGRVVIVEPNAWNPLIQLQMFRIRGFNTILTKTDQATGEKFVYGNERLLFGSTMKRLFRQAGVHGSTRTFRVLPTALAGKPAFVRGAEIVEKLKLCHLIPPLAIHCVYSGTKAG
ncbi:class I SAM-dependent methyltransferase [Thalassospira sp.]|uniref:class I SAM-dependent methyltransferase n=1 Tax=Thalassospira sp. TaxID=1912094 RepID=UPI0025F0CAD6|nr:class I SAM-dependent methyltransferase [Thalassospira sp.]